ncbi:MAG: hypothetical protein RLZZ387_4259 [Chloroflexota bacterium]|jgi:DUF1680 family protein
MPPRSLLQPALQPLPLGAVRPAGWLLRQLRIQADGLSGHLDEIWPDVADSAWIGGAAEGWERGPYWLDGAVPLAFLLDDPLLKQKVARWVDAILERQHPDGWLGPLRDTSDTRRLAYDPWPVFVALKALTQYQEATGDPRIIPAALRFLRFLEDLLARQPLFDWGRYRWPDLAVTLFWLHERTGEDWLLDLAATSYQQSFDWRAHFAREPFAYPEKQRREQIHPPAPPEPLTTFRTDLASHVVNNAMALKQPGLWYRLSHDPADRDAVHQMIGVLDHYHGQATGVFTGDEHLAGTSPSQGTELCAVVEYMYSLEMLVAALGDVRLADRLERITFNALPATFSPDMWAHQYVQQANQVVCAIAEDRVYTNNNADANLFGLEPHYGCCTANMHQGWPKFAAHLWMGSPDGGLAAVSYAPCIVQAELAGQAVRVTVETNYPFDETVRVVVEADAPARFPLHLRVPAWAEGATVAVGDGPPEPAAAGAFARVERTWEGRTAVELRLPMRLVAERRFNGSVAIERGPLVFALRVGEEWRPVEPYNRSGPTADPRVAYDYEVHPTTPWGYALDLDLGDLDGSLRLVRRGVGEVPFSPEGAPLELCATAYRVPGWGVAHGAAEPPPADAAATEPAEEVALVPYGCTNLRVTELPLARR